jgi:hypothetical protein
MQREGVVFFVTTAAGTVWYGNNAERAIIVHINRVSNYVSRVVYPETTSLAEVEAHFAAAWRCMADVIDWLPAGTPRVYQRHPNAKVMARARRRQKLEVERAKANNHFLVEAHRQAVAELERVIAADGPEMLAADVANLGDIPVFHQPGFPVYDATNFVEGSGLPPPYVFAHSLPLMRELLQANAEAAGML